MLLFAPCLSLVWVGCLVWVFSPSLSLYCIYLIFHTSFYISFRAGKIVLPVDITSQFLKCWSQTLFCRILLGFFTGPGHCTEHEAIVEMEVETLLFACQIENWEHPTPAETKTDWQIFYSCPFVLSFCLFSTIILAMFFLIVSLDQQIKLNIDQWTWFFTLSPYAGRTRLQCPRVLFYHLIHVV